MGRLNKALARIKEREHGKGPKQVGPGSGASLKSAGLEPVKDLKRLKKIRFDDDTLSKNRIITKGMDPSIRTSYKMLRTRILQSMRSNNWNSLAVTSASQGDGKTVTAINLAISLAGDVNQNVCLVDLDLRHSSIAEYLNISGKIGLSDVLLHSKPLTDALLQTQYDRLTVLPNFVTQDHSSEILSSPAMADLTSTLCSQPNSMVIFDLPPVLAADDMLAFAPFVDAILFVVSEGSTQRTDAMKSSEVLKDLNIIGTVLNRSDEKTAAYY